MSESATEQSRDNGGKPQQGPSSPFTPAGASWNFQKGAWVDAGSSKHPNVREYVVDIAPGGFLPLGSPSEDGVKPQSGQYWLNGQRIDRETRPSHHPVMPSSGRPNLPA